MWGSMIERGFQKYSARARQRRAEMFRNAIPITAGAKILDLGGGAGTHIASILPMHANITVADVSEDDLKVARARGYKTVRLSDAGVLPFADQEFDVVFCSSVIEHVTGPKAHAIAEKSSKSFQRMAWHYQSLFAQEIRRISKAYFVQTPYRYFPIESHSWLPMPIVMLPRPILSGLLKSVGKMWLKTTLPDWHLLTKRQMRQLFPDAVLLLEKSGGLTKSLIAVRRAS